MERRIKVQDLITRVREMYARDLGSQHIEILYQAARRTLKGQEYSPSRAQEDSLPRLVTLGFGIKHESRARGITFEVKPDFIAPSLMLPTYDLIFRTLAGRSADQTRSTFAELVQLLMDEDVIGLVQQRGTDSLAKFEHPTTDYDIARTPRPDLEMKAVHKLVAAGVMSEKVKKVFFGLLGTRREYLLKENGKVLVQLAIAAKELMDQGFTFDTEGKANTGQGDT